MIATMLYHSYIIIIIIIIIIAIIIEIMILKYLVSEGQIGGRI